MITNESFGKGLLYEKYIEMAQKIIYEERYSHRKNDVKYLKKQVLNPRKTFEQRNTLVEHKIEKGLNDLEHVNCDKKNIMIKNINIEVCAGHNPEDE